MGVGAQGEMAPGWVGEPSGCTPCLFRGADGILDRVGQGTPFPSSLEKGLGTSDPTA